MNVADLHPIRREHRAHGIAIVISHEDRACARYDSNDRLAVLLRRKCSEEPATILIVDYEHEWNAGKSRFVRLGIRMMGPYTDGDRMTVALPGTAHLRHLGVSSKECHRRCRKRRKCHDPGNVTAWYGSFHAAIRRTASHWFATCRPLRLSRVLIRA